VQPVQSSTATCNVYFWPGNSFQRASVLVINKVDLVPYVDSDVSAIRRHARLANPDLQIFETSCRTGEGIAEWAGWLAVQAERRRAS
jgi:hydrogenase nickel incorporation protein HypB